MSDHPIIFSAPMILALLDGRKTITRRLAWRQVQDKLAGRMNDIETPWRRVKPGDRLWCRETWQKHMDYATVEDARRCCENVGSHFGIVRAATPPTSWAPAKWRSPIHMPRWASRLTLVITATKIERLQEISEADAKAEGVNQGPTPVFADSTYRWGFQRIWRNLHGVEAWDANPEVVAISFSVHKTNIDAMPKAEAA